MGLLYKANFFRQSSLGIYFPLNYFREKRRELWFVKLIRNIKYPCYILDFTGSSFLVALRILMSWEVDEIELKLLT